ncbi:MAG: hypothetical protein ABI797_07900 [Chloroflexota bacterium]
MNGIDGQLVELGTHQARLRVANPAGLHHVMGAVQALGALRRATEPDRVPDVTPDVEHRVGRSLSSRWIDPHDEDTDRPSRGLAAVLQHAQAAAGVLYEEDDLDVIRAWDVGEGRLKRVDGRS